MSQPTKYEQLIAAKLQAIPVPDMADAIWSRIEEQLDIDMPTDDGNGGAGPSAPSGPGVWGWGLSIVIVALVSIFLLFKNKPKTNNSTQQNITAPAEQINAPIENAKGPPGKINTEDKSTNALPTGPANNPTLGQFDSTMPVVFPAIVPQPDTARSTINNIVVPPPVAAMDTPPPKKKRGVSGMTDNDYKIVPKKNE